MGVGTNSVIQQSCNFDQPDQLLPKPCSDQLPYEQHSTNKLLANEWPVNCQNPPPPPQWFQLMNRSTEQEIDPIESCFIHPDFPIHLLMIDTRRHLRGETPNYGRKKSSIPRLLEGHHAPLIFCICAVEKKKDKTRRNINRLTLCSPSLSLLYYRFSQAAYVSEIFPACSSLFCSWKQEGLKQAEGQIFLWVELRRLSNYAVLFLFDTSDPVWFWAKTLKTSFRVSKGSTINHESFQYLCVCMKSPLYNDKNIKIWPNSQSCFIGGVILSDLFITNNRYLQTVHVNLSYFVMEFLFILSRFFSDLCCLKRCFWVTIVS